MITKTPEEQKKIIGKTISRLVKESSLDKKDILEKLKGVSSWDSVNKYLTGRSFPSITNIFIMGELFDCGYDYILTGGAFNKGTFAVRSGEVNKKDMEERLMEWKELYKAQSEQLKMANELVAMKQAEIDKLKKSITSGL